jgi:hypothetical protein
MRFDARTGVLLGLAAGLVFAAAVALLARRLQRWRGRRRSLRGQRLEAAAPDALRRAGYRVLRHHPEASYDLAIDGRERPTRLQADYLVARGRRRYVVEVKSGGGADPARRATRRQLLEYAVGFEVDGVLLLDAERGRLYRVDFPLQRAPSAGRWWLLVGIGLGAALAGLWFH